MQYFYTLLWLKIFCGTLLISAAHGQNKTPGYIDNGIAKARQRDYSAAIQAFTQEIKINPDNFQAYVYRAYAKEALKNYEGAIQDYTKAATIKPDDQELYYSMALTKYVSGDRKGACTDWKRSVDLGSPEAGYMLIEYCK